MDGHPNALRLIAETLAGRIRPPLPIPLSRWLPENLVLVDGPASGSFWRAEGAPYLTEIADCLTDDHPCNLVTVRKAQQTGASILALGWSLYVADREPANMLYAVPGLDALRDINGQKLQPLIDAWQKKKRRTVFVPQTSRSGAGSTTYEKKFPGGYLSLANANAVMDLSMKTVKKGVKDEVSKWGDIPGFGDPETLFFGRFTAFRRTKDYKILEISTPEIDSGDEMGEAVGHCRIDRSFRRSDQRFWHCACPECGSLFVHDFAQFRIDRDRPSRSAYECKDCGHLISEAERVLGVREGSWIARAAGPDRHPGFHIDAFISLMMSYEAIAEDWIKAQKSETSRKDFSNLVLALPYRFKGDAPDYKLLMERREEGLTRGTIPPAGLILTAGVDVQMRGIWVEVLAHAPNRRTWPVEVLYLDGDTDSPDAPVFGKLTAILNREWADAFGGARRVDAMAIDSGYRTHVVYAWARQNQRMHPDTGRDVILPVKGLENWGRPAIGTPTLVDIDLAGRKIVRQGAKVWGVGTWPLKADFYSKLAIARPDLPGMAPDGYCHFGLWLDDVYFRQLTAEHLEDIKVRGRTIGRRWVSSGDNHLLDCRIYNMAMAEYLGLSSTTEAEWAAFALRRGVPADLLKTDLFTPRAEVSAPAPAGSGSGESAKDRSTESEWLGRNTDNWNKR